MRAANQPVQRPSDARLLTVDRRGELRHGPRSRFIEALTVGDLLVANDAATLPASLVGRHRRSEEAIEVRLAGRRTLAADDLDFTAITFGAGDPRARTEDRQAPPLLQPGDSLDLGPLRAVVRRRLGHPRLVLLRFEGHSDAVWEGIARHGRPIQYAYLKGRLALWDVWTRIAARPVAFEAPSAGFLLDWGVLRALQERGVGFRALTLAAGISSTGDSRLDARLPFDEPYEIPVPTVEAIERTRARGGRVVAIGTTVARALEHAASRGTLRAGPGVANQRLGPGSEVRLVDAIVTGAHEPGTSHYLALHAFAGEALLQRVAGELEAKDYRTHEFGDSVLIERQDERLAERSGGSLGYFEALARAR